MKNLITCAFAFKEGFQTSQQLNKTADNSTTEMYLKNLFVALVSAKKQNPEDDVVLCVNVEPSSKWISLFEQNNITVRKIEFDSFVVPREFPWSLAFFKMCVLNTLVKEGNYDRYLIMDADTYTTHPFDDMWQEADKGILLTPLGHTYSHSDREVIRRDFEKLYPGESKILPIVHYGGEYVCGNQRMLSEYMDCCFAIFNKVADSGFNVENKIGDESIWSIAASLLINKLPIIAATPYIFRFWTDEMFYLISSVTINNPVSIWHLPSEKETGFVRLYKYYTKNKAFPDIRKSAKMFGIRILNRPYDKYTFSNKVSGKLRKWKIRK